MMDPNGQTLSQSAAPPGGCELTILLPCLNEATTLSACIAEAQRFLRRHRVEGEVLVADNGSTDGSRDIALAADARVIEVAERGYGAALMAGIRAARGRYVIMGDSDGSYDLEHLGGFLKELRAGYDLAMGNRFSGGIAPGAMPFLNRYVGNPVLSGLGRIFFGSSLGDFHCGLRGFNRDAILRLDLRMVGMEFASEMVVETILAGLRVAEVPTTLSPDGRDRPPHLRPWRDGWRHLRFLLMYAPDWLFLYPGLILAILGMVVMLAVLPGPLVLGSVVFDVHTLVMATGAILLGVQMVIFFVLAKTFAVTEGLLPQSPKFMRLSSALSLERLAFFGSFTAIAGAVGCVWAVLLWSNASFGDLDYSWMMRLIVPSVALTALGAQVLFGGFLKGILELKLQRPARVSASGQTSGAQAGDEVKLPAE